MKVLKGLEEGSATSFTFLFREVFIKDSVHRGTRNQLNYFLQSKVNGCNYWGEY